jgi:hypothetical protein
MPKNSASSRSPSGGPGTFLGVLTQLASWIKGSLENLTDQLNHHINRLARHMMGLVLLTVLMAAGSVFFITGTLLYITEKTGASTGLVFGIGGAFLFLACALVLALKGR